MLALASVVVFPLESFAQDIPDDDGEEIEITVREGSIESGSGRFLSVIPVDATLFRSFYCIEVEFLDNIGEVTITLTNFTTGSLSSIVVDSQVGSVVVPFVPISGMWQISFQPEGGQLFTGFFYY